MLPFLRTTVTLAVVALVLPVVARAERVVAMGDVHGAFEEFASILEASGLIDAEHNWSGGDSVLVQTGDLLDRGVRVREVLDLIIELEGQAAAAGGRVVALLGNHEVQNLVGFLDGVPMEGQPSDPVYATFAGPDVDELRRDAAKRWSRWQRSYPRCSAPSRSAWLAERPPGYFEYVASLRPDGIYGEWLRRRKVVARLDDTIFLHGGLSPALSEWGLDTVDAVNAAVAAELRRWDEDRALLEGEEIALPFSDLAEIYCALQAEVAALASKRGAQAVARHETLAAIQGRLPVPSNWLAFAAEGPLWFRGYARWSDAEGGALLDEVAAAFDARRFVVGHTPQTEGIVSRFDGRLFLIDTAMTFGEAAGGTASALEFSEGNVYALYPDSRVALTRDATPLPAEVPQSEPATVGASIEAPVTRSWLGPDGEVLPFPGPAEVLDFLSNAPITSVQDIPTGVTRPKKLMLERDGVRSKAAFRYVDVRDQRKRLSTGKMVMFFVDSYRNEVAAYELARLMALDNVPPAVLREVDGQQGSVQIWVEDSMMETERRADGVKPPDQLRFNRQFYEMRVFDNLINNVDRNQGNILLDADWKLWMIDHTRAFTRDKKLVAPADVIQCSRPFWEALRSVPDETIEAALSPFMPTPELRALLERRRRLVALIEEKVAAEGERAVLFNYGDPHHAVSIQYGEVVIPPAPDDGT